MNAASLSGAAVLVTGGAGFVGSHLVRALLEGGAAVTVLEGPRAPLGLIQDLASRLSLVEADLTDANAVSRAMATLEPSVIFHLAGWTGGRSRAGDAAAWERSYQVNLHGTLHLLGALGGRAGGLRRIVRTGTMEEYGDGPAPFREDQRERAVSPYSASMVAATQAAHAWAAQHGMPLVTVRPSIIYGPGQPADFFIAGLIRACLAGEDFPMTRGEQTGDFIYVADVAEALIAAAVADGATGQVFNAGAGVETKVRALAERIVALSGTRSSLKVGAIPGRPGESERRFMDVTRARDTLGWSARTELDAGLLRTIEAFRRNAAAPREG